MTEGQPFPPPPQPGGYLPPSPADGHPPGEARRRWREDHGVVTYTSWIRRVGASLIDRILLVILLYAAPVGAVAAGQQIGDKSCVIDPDTGATSCTTLGIGPLIGVIVAAFFCLLALAYWLWNWGYRQGRTGSSIGKSALKFGVVSERTGQPIGFWMSVVRQIAHVLDGFCNIGYLLPLFTAKRQTIADMLMGTVCLPVEPVQAAPPARRSRTPAILAGATAVVVAVAAVLVFVFVSHKSASRQVVLPFTGLNDPRGVAVDTNGAVYVTDQGNNRVLKLPAGAATQTALPFTGLNKPSGVAVDTAGAVYVVDQGNKRVLKLAAGATTPTTLPFTGLTAPEGVAVDATGAVYLVNANGSSYAKDEGNNRVLKLAAGASAPATLPFAFAASGLGPTGVAVDGAGGVYVAEDQVLRLAPGATAPDTLPFTVTKASFGGAWGVAVDPAGTVYITDPYWQRVVKMAAGSTTQSVLPFSRIGRPYAVAVDTAGTVYVTEGSNRVLKLPA